MIILGLDISTACIGWSIINSKKTSPDLGYIRLHKIKDTYKKVKHTQEILSDLNSKYKFDKIFVEAPLQRFSYGRSSAKTIITLASFNGMIRYMCYSNFDIVSKLLDVSEARKLAGIQLLSPKKAGIKHKEQVFQWTTKNLSYSWPTKILKSGPRKGQQIIIEQAYDMSDAYVIALAGFKQMKSV